MKASPIQNDFTGGEFSPLFYAKSDTDVYRTGLETCLNYIPLIQGPITRRPGTYFVSDETTTIGVAGNVKLWGFEYSNVQAYVIQFSDQKIRFYRNNAIVESSPGVPYEISSPYVDIDTRIKDMHVIQSADVVYIFSKFVKPKTLTRLGHTNWVLADFPDSDGPYMKQNEGATTLTPSATTGAITITASAALFDTSSAGINEIGRVVRIKHSSTWGYAKITGVVSATVVNATVINAFGATTAVTIWRLGLWCGVNGFPGTGTFHEDRLFVGGNTNFPQRIDGSVVSDYTNFQPSATDGTVTAANAVSFTLNSKDVNVIQWLTSDEKGLLCGTTSSEWTIRAASSLEAMTAVNITAKRGSSIGSTGVQPVQAGRSALHVQKSGLALRDMRYYFDVDGFRSADLSVLSDHITVGGITQIALQKDPQTIVWAVRGDGVLLGFNYEREFEAVKAGWQQHKLGGEVASLGADHGVVKSVAVIPSADGTRDEVWVAVRRRINDVEKVYVEYLTKFFDDEDHQTEAFYVDSGLTYDLPKTITVLDRGNPTEILVGSHGLAEDDRIVIRGTGTYLDDQVFKVGFVDTDNITLKTLSGDVVDTTETLEASKYFVGTVRKQITSVSGLSHLNGATVAVVTDGKIHPDKTVSGGAITLDYPAATIHVGFNYTSDLKTLRFQAGATDGTALGKTRRTHRLGLFLHRTLGLHFGTSFSKLERLIFRKGNDIPNKATELFSGIVSENLPASYDFDNQICIRQDKPLPGTILAIMPQLVTQDRG